MATRKDKRPTKGGGVRPVSPGKDRTRVQAELDTLNKAAAILLGPNRPRTAEDFYGSRGRILADFAAILPAASRLGLKAPSQLLQLQSIPAPDINTFTTAARDLMLRLPARDQHENFDEVRQRFMAAFRQVEAVARRQGLNVSSGMQALYNNARANFGRMLGGPGGGSNMLNEAEAELETMLVRAGL